MPSANYFFPHYKMQLVPRKNRGQFLSPFDRFFDDDFFGFPSIFRDSTGGMFTPNLDISETDEAIEITADLPGFKKEDIEVTLDDGFLSISGTMKEEKEEKDEDRKYYCKQCSSGSFMRKVALPTSAIQSDAKCKMEDGKLKIYVPKKKEEIEAKGRKLESEG